MSAQQNHNPAHLPALSAAPTTPHQQVEKRLSKPQLPWWVGAMGWRSPLGGGAREEGRGAQKGRHPEEAVLPEVGECRTAGQGERKAGVGSSLQVRRKGEGERWGAGGWGMRGWKEAAGK